MSIQKWLLRLLSGHYTIFEIGSSLHGYELSALVNNLTGYDVQKERESVDAFVAAVREGVELFRSGFSGPRIPSWEHILTRMPGARIALKKLVEEDIEEHRPW